MHRRSGTAVSIASTTKRAVGTGSGPRHGTAGSDGARRPITRRGNGPASSRTTALGAGFPATLNRGRNARMSRASSTAASSVEVHERWSIATA